MGVMLLPIVASLSEDAMTAVPNDLRAGAYALGEQRGSQVSTRIVVPAAIRGSSRRSCSHLAGIGETMIVLIAGWHAAELHVRSAVLDRDDDRVHRRRPPTATFQRVDRVQDDLRRRPDAVRADAGDEPDRDPARAASTERCTSDRRGAATRPLGLDACSSVALVSLPGGRGVITLIVLFGQGVDRFPGLPASTSLLENLAVRPPELAGARPAILGVAVPRGVGLRVLGADRGSARRSTSRSMPRRNAGTTGLLELNIQNLAGVPSIVYGILGLAFLVGESASAVTLLPAR